MLWSCWYGSESHSKNSFWMVDRLQTRSGFGANSFVIIDQATIIMTRAKNFLLDFSDQIFCWIFRSISCRQMFFLEVKCTKLKWHSSQVTAYQQQMLFNFRVKLSIHEITSDWSVEPVTFLKHFFDHQTLAAAAAAATSILSSILQWKIRNTEKSSLHFLSCLTTFCQSRNPIEYWTWVCCSWWSSSLAVKKSATFM